MNQNGQPHSSAWVTFTYASFAASAFLIALGVFIQRLIGRKKTLRAMRKAEAAKDA